MGEILLWCYRNALLFFAFPSAERGPTGTRAEFHCILRETCCQLGIQGDENRFNEPASCTAILYSERRVSVLTQKKKEGAIDTVLGKKQRESSSKTYRFQEKLLATVLEETEHCNWREGLLKENVVLVLVPRCIRKETGPLLVKAPVMETTKSGGLGTSMCPRLNDYWENYACVSHTLHTF